MLKVHFNGEIVRCRDMKQIANRTKERNDQEHRCMYGIQQYRCNTYLENCKKEAEVKKIDTGKKCLLTHCADCPQYNLRKLQGNKQKTYTIDWKKYRQIASSAHYLIKTSQHKTLFLTLTFPAFKKKHKLTKSFYYDEISNINRTASGTNIPIFRQR